MKFDIEKIFLEHIAKRGYEYYKENKVKNIVLNKNSINGQVQENKIYDVEIEIVNDDIENIKCSCKNFKEGNKCKHLAAMMYYVQNHCKEYIEEHKKRLKNNINKIDNDIFKEYIINEIINNNKLKTQVIEKFQKYFEIKDISIYIEKIIKAKEYLLNNVITEEEFYEDDYYEDDELYIFECIGIYKNKINNILQELIKYVDTYKKEKIVKVIDTLFKNIPQIEEENVYEQFYYAYEEMIEELNNIISEFFIQLECKQMQDKIIKLVNDNGYYLINNKITLLNYLNYLIEKNKNLNEVEILLKQYIKDSPKQEYIMLLINIYDKQKREKEKLETLFKYKKIRIIAELLVNTLIAKKEYDLAIKTIEEILKETNETSEDYDIEEYDFMQKLPYNKSEFRYNILTKLLNIYQILNMKKEYEETLIKMLVQYRYAEIELYIKLKESINKELWGELKKELINDIGHSKIIYEIYDLENELENLCKYIVENQDTYHLYKYESKLIDKYEEELFYVLINDTNKTLEYNEGRPGSQKVAEKLLHLKKYINMKQKLIEYTEEIIKKYPKRRTLKEELKKVKLI